MINFDNNAASQIVLHDLLLTKEIRRLRDRLEKEILKKIPNSRPIVTDDLPERPANTSYISFGNINGEMIMSRLESHGVRVSTTSACGTPGHEPSRVLQAMNTPYSQAMGTIRFSLGRSNTDEEVDFVISVLPGIIEDLRLFAGEKY